MVVYTTLTDRVFSVNQLFITHPEFRGYFYEGKHVCRETVGENYDRIVAVAEYILDFCSTLQEHRDILEEKDLFAVLEEKGVIKALKRRGMLRPLQRIDLFQVLRRRCVSWSEWTEYIEDLFESSPMLCQILLEKREWYEESLWNLSPLLREEVREELVDSGTREPIRKFEAERIERILHRLFPPDADAEGGAPSGGVPSPGDIPSLFGGGQAPVVPGLLLGDETSATAPSPLLKSVPPTPRHVRWRTRKWKMARQGAATPPPSGQVSGTTASLDDADASRGLLNLGESDPEASA